jgi:hypothetical protein
MCKDKRLFKLKRYGFFRVILKTFSYNQVPGIDFNVSNAPVINYVSFRIMLVRMILWNLKAKNIDIQTTFFYCDLEESIFMDTPSAMEY